MKFLSGMLAGLLLLGLGAAAFVLSGVFDVSATVHPSKLEKQLAGAALDRSVARRAPNTSNPVAPSPEVLRAGLAHYRGICVTCHGAPGVDASEIGIGLNPPAPDLTLRKVQRRTDGELFWLVSHGIRMTGMPAFGPTHEDEDIWKIVAFLRHLPEITPEEEKELEAGGAVTH
ncbi:MAG: cytochrome c [Thermoanaerobaculia bacterium]